jgi:hypothetical protein
VPTYQDDPVVSRSHTPNAGSVVGANEDQSDRAGPGVFGTSKGTGVWGESQTWHGVYGKSASTTGGAGVMGAAVGPGVIGESQTWHGLYGKSASTTGGAGVMGEAVGPGVIGKSQTWHGVYGETSGSGESGAAAVWGEHKTNGSGVVGVSAKGAGVFAQGRPAGFFKGDVFLTGDLRVEGVDKSLRDLLKRLAELERDLAELRRRVPLTGETLPEIEVTSTKRFGDHVAIDCDGRGFIPYSGVTVSVRSLGGPTASDIYPIGEHTDQADASGNVKTGANVYHCAPGTHLRVEATDHRHNTISDVVASNVVTVTCP